MRLALWPQSLFGRLIAASVLAVLLAQVAGFVLIARERERFVLQGNVRDWARRITEITYLLQPLNAKDRATTVDRLIQQQHRHIIRALPGMGGGAVIGWTEPGAATLVAAAGGTDEGPLFLQSGQVTALVPGKDGSAPETHVGPPGLTVRTMPPDEGPGVRPALGPPDGESRGTGPSGPPDAEARGPGRPGLSPEDAPPGFGPFELGPPPSEGSRPPDAPKDGPPSVLQDGAPSPRPDGPRTTMPRRGNMRGLSSSPFIFIPVPLPSDFEQTFRQQLQTNLGSTYQVSLTPAAAGTPSQGKIIPVSGPFFEPRDGPGKPYDVSIRFPDRYTAVFRIWRQPGGAPIPRNLLLNLLLLVVILVIMLYVTARSITRPLSELANAADSLGRDTRQPKLEKLEERGAREIRRAAHAFNTMQDRLHRYLDSRTRVLAAMSHDLKTPLTRLRLQVETLNDPSAQTRIGKELDEMESMVRGALALFRGLNDDETMIPVDINELLQTVRTEFAEMGEDVDVEGSALLPFAGKSQALKRCLTNLVVNAIKFGRRAMIVVEDAAALVIRVRDEGPGIPPAELEKVFEPFYRVESSRSRDTGGSGLGLSIARDIAQAHGGSLVLRNLPDRGLEALLILPRRR